MQLEELDNLVDGDICALWPRLCSRLQAQVIRRPVCSKVNVVKRAVNQGPLQVVDARAQQRHELDTRDRI